MKDGKITNNQRIVAALGTVEYAIKNDAKSIVLMSHLGRPNGQKNMKFTLKPVATVLSELLKRYIFFCNCRVYRNYNIFKRKLSFLSI